MSDQTAAAELSPQEKIEAELHDLQAQEEAIRDKKRSLNSQLAALIDGGEGVTQATRELIAASLGVQISDAEWIKVRQSIRCLAQGKRYFHSGQKHREVKDADGTVTDSEFVRHTIHIAAARANNDMVIAGEAYAKGELVWAEDLFRDQAKADGCTPLASKVPVSRAVAKLLACCRAEKLSPVVAGQMLAALDESVFATLQIKEGEAPAAAQ